MRHALEVTRIIHNYSVGLGQEQVVQTEMVIDRPRRPVVAYLICFCAVAIAAAIGSAVTLPKIDHWYAGIAKPAFTPPNAVFGPAWTLLYTLMAIAGARVLVKCRGAAMASGAMRLFWAQLALNAFWSPVFFGFEAPRPALAIIVALFATVILTIRAFWRADRLAALLLVP
jgi:benzodiazapine receptor